MSQLIYSFYKIYHDVCIFVVINVKKDCVPNLLNLDQEFKEKKNEKVLNVLVLRVLWRTCGF